MNEKCEVKETNVNDVERDDVDRVIIPGEELKFIPKRYDDMFHCW